MVGRGGVTVVVAAAAVVGIAVGAVALRSFEQRAPKSIGAMAPVLQTKLLDKAREVAARSMSAPGTAQAVEASFRDVSRIVWPGERVFGDAQEAYQKDQMLVVLITQNVNGFARQIPSADRSAPITPPARLGTVVSFYDVTRGEVISSSTWESGAPVGFDFNSLGRPVTFDVPASAITAADS